MANRRRPRRSPAPPARCACAPQKSRNLFRRVWSSGALGAGNRGHRCRQRAVDQLHGSVAQRNVAVVGGQYHRGARLASSRNSRARGGGRRVGLPVGSSAITTAGRWRERARSPPAFCRRRAPRQLVGLVRDATRSAGRASAGAVRGPGRCGRIHRQHDVFRRGQGRQQRKNWNTSRRATPPRRQPVGSIWTRCAHFDRAGGRVVDAPID